jgi:hypothetical protein
MAEEAKPTAAVETEKSSDDAENEWKSPDGGERKPEEEPKGRTYRRGERVHLSQFRGKPVVLYFYPKDDTAE